MFQRFPLLLLAAVSAAASGVAGSNRCVKEPRETTVAMTEETDNGFAITITGSPRKYRPHQTYTISLEVGKSFFSREKEL